MVFLHFFTNPCSGVFEEPHRVGICCVIYSRYVAAFQLIPLLLLDISSCRPSMYVETRNRSRFRTPVNWWLLKYISTDLHGPNTNSAAELFNALDRRYNDGPKPARDDITKWAALGDSFSAGPGAGCFAANDEGKCWRRLGAYAPQLNQSAMFQDEKPEGFDQPEVDFGACSGAKMPKVSGGRFAFSAQPRTRSPSRTGN